MFTPASWRKQRVAYRGRGGRCSQHPAGFGIVYRLRRPSVVLVAAVIVVTEQAQGLQVRGTADLRAHGTTPARHLIPLDAALLQWAAPHSVSTMPTGCVFPLTS